MSEPPAYPPAVPPPVYGPVPELPAVARAHFGRRTGAFLVDFGLAVVPGIVAGLAARSAGVEDDDPLGYGALAVIVIWVLNRGVLAAFTSGQTLGRMVAGLRVIRTDGRAARLTTVLWRDVLARMLTFIPLVFLLDSLLTTSTDRRSLLDRMASTLVVTTPAAAGRSRTLVALATVLTVAWVGAWAALADWDTSDDTYSSFDRDMFISGCTEDGTSESLCACTFDRIEATVDYPTYRRLDHLPDPDDWPPGARRAIADAFTACD